jgi:hypothetical protein
MFLEVSKIVHFGPGMLLLLLLLGHQLILRGIPTTQAHQPDILHPCHPTFPRPTQTGTWSKPIS